MSAGLAHEFKNAIATLHGYVQFLQSLELDDRASSAASSLLNEVRNLSDMVTSFLNFARPQPLQVHEVNLHELIADCAGELAPLFKQTKVELLITGIAGVSPAVTDTRDKSKAKELLIRADERMLRQALINLMRNAAEAIPQNQADRRVDILSSTERDQAGDEWAVIEIKIPAKGFLLPTCSVSSFPSLPPRRPDTELAWPWRIA